jgi:hypothetical protein
MAAAGQGAATLSAVREDSDIEDAPSNQEQEQQQPPPAAEAARRIRNAPQAINNAWGKIHDGTMAVLQGLSLSNLMPWYTAQVTEAQQLLETAGSDRQQRQAQERLLAAQRAEQALRLPECVLVMIRPDGKVRAHVAACACRRAACPETHTICCRWSTSARTPLRRAGWVL